MVTHTPSHGAGFRVQGAGFRVQGSGFRVQGHPEAAPRRAVARVVRVYDRRLVPAGSSWFISTSEKLSVLNLSKVDKMTALSRFLERVVARVVHESEGGGHCPVWVGGEYVNLPSTEAEARRVSTVTGSPTWLRVEG